MEFFKTCKMLPIYNFNEVLKTNDFRFLVKGFEEFEDEEENFKLGVDETIEARGIFKEILYEYSALTANRHIMLKYNAEIKIKEEEFKYMIIERVLDNYVNHGDVAVLELLNKINIRFDSNGDIEEQITKVILIAKRLKTKISLMIVKFNEKFNRNIKQRIKDEIIDRLEEEAIELSIALKIGYAINTKKTSVKQWISMWNVAGKINKPVTTN